MIDSLSNKPADHPERERALDPTQSFICEAPAGSGKTELLTQRFLNLLARVQRPEQVLAITFTRKAVGEMRERILSALQAALAPQPNEPHKQTTWKLASAVLKVDNSLGWHLLHNPNRLQVKTFDSLCASLTHCMPLESALGSKPQVSEDAAEMHRRAVRALLNSLEDDAPWSDSLAVLLQQMDNRFSRLEDLLMHMLAKREQWLPLMATNQSQEHIRHTLEHNLRSIIRDTVAKVSGLIPYFFHRELMALAAFAAANLRRLQRVSPILDCLDMDLHHESLPGHSDTELARWRGLVTLLTTNKGEWRASLSKRCGFPSGDTAEEKQQFKQQKQRLLHIIDQLQAVEGLQQALADLRLLPGTEFSGDQWQLLDALSQVLPILAAQLMLVFQETNKVDFVELSLRARRALGALDNPSQLALKMDYRLQHILVDEFQDTSASQVELLNQLTAGWQIDDGRTLFCVGDAMQSIYGFRGANVGLFLSCREHGMQHVALAPLRLVTNFRSQAGIVNWVNQVFQSAFPSRNDMSSGAVVYTPSQAFHGKSAERAVWVHGFVDRKDQRDNYDEARTILGIVRKTRSEQTEATIAILVRNRSHAAHILPLLKEAGVPYRAVDLERLQDQAVIQDLMALTQALLHPADRIAWLAVLRAPWCGLSLVDLEAIANYHSDDSEPAHSFAPVLQQVVQLRARSGQQHYTDEPHPKQNDFFLAQTGQDSGSSALSDDGQERLNRVLPVLCSAQHNKDRKPLRSWIEGTWLALGGAACVEDEEALKNAEKYFELLETWPYADALPAIETLKKSVSQLYAAPDPKADERLQIMTIHKSKGLEFDVVIVPALHRAPRSEDPALLMWHERLNAHSDKELIMAPITAVGKDTHPTYLHLQAEAAKRTRYENCRLLYVACTRAKQTLHLSAHVKQDPSDSLRLKPAPKSSLLHSIWEPIQNRIRRYPVKAAAEIKAEMDTHPAASAPARPLLRLARNWQQPPLSEGHLLDAFVPPYNYSDNNIDETAWPDQSPRAIGTTVHRYLQQIGETGVQHWNQETIYYLQPQIAQFLSNLGVTPQQMASAVDKVRHALQKVLQDTKAAVFLCNQHPFHACEYPLSINTREGPKNLHIDRVYTDKQGCTWLVDYKTSQPEPEQDLATFLQQQIEEHKEQLTLYKRALQQAGFQQIKTALYFPMMAYWLALE